MALPAKPKRAPPPPADESNPFSFKTFIGASADDEVDIFAVKAPTKKPVPTAPTDIPRPPPIRDAGGTGSLPSGLGSSLPPLSSSGGPPPPPMAPSSGPPPPPPMSSSGPPPPPPMASSSGPPPPPKTSVGFVPPLFKDEIEVPFPKTNRAFNNGVASAPPSLPPVSRVDSDDDDDDEDDSDFASRLPKLPSLPKSANDAAVIQALRAQLQEALDKVTAADAESQMERQQFSATLLKERKRIKALEQQLQEVRDREKAETAALEAAARRIEHNLEAATQRALAAETLVTRLQADLASTLSQLQQERIKSAAIAAGTPMPAQAFFGANMDDVQSTIFQLASTLEKATADAQLNLQKLSDTGKLIAATAETMRMVGKFQADK